MVEIALGGPAEQGVPEGRGRLLQKGQERRLGQLRLLGRLGRLGTLRSLKPLRALRTLRADGRRGHRPFCDFWLWCYLRLGAVKTQSARQVQGRQNDASPILAVVLSAFGSGKNAECEANFVTNKKAGPQFAFANEDPLIAVRCKISPQYAFFTRLFLPLGKPSRVCPEHQQVPAHRRQTA